MGGVEDVEGPWKERYVSMEELSRVLWRERELLDLLLFKLEEEQLVLASGRSRWLGYAAREVETVLDSIRQTEVLRATTADAVAASLGLENNLGLRALAESTDEPWRTILLDHRDAFVAVTAQITAMAMTSRELLTAGYQAARATTVPLSNGTGTYTADGSVGVAAPVIDATVLDSRLKEVTYQASLATIARVLHRSLTDFLR